MSTDDQNTPAPAPAAAAPVDPWHAPGLRQNVQAAQDAVAALPQPAPRLVPPQATQGAGDAFTAAVARVANLEGISAIQGQQITALATALDVATKKLDDTSAGLASSAQAGADTVSQLSQMIADLAQRVRDLELANSAPPDGSH